MREGPVETSFSSFEGGGSERVPLAEDYKKKCTPSTTLVLGTIEGVGAGRASGVLLASALPSEFIGKNIPPNITLALSGTIRSGTYPTP